MAPLTTDRRQEWYKVLACFLLIAMGGTTVIAGHAVVPMALVFLMVLLGGMAGDAGVGGIVLTVTLAAMCAASVVAAHVLERTKYRQASRWARNIMLTLVALFVPISAVLSFMGETPVETERSLVLFITGYAAVLSTAVCLLASRKWMLQSALAALCLLALLAPAYSIFISESQLLTMVTGLPSIGIAGAVVTWLAVGKTS